MAELLGWGAGGMQLLQQEKVQNAALEMDRLASNIAVAKAQREEKEAALDEQAGQMMASIGSGEGPGGVPAGNTDGIENPADAMERMGYFYAKGGSPKKAQDAFAAAARYRKDAAAAAKSETTARSDAFKTELAQADFVYRELGTVQDEAGWESALTRLEESNLLAPEEMAALRDLEYSPDVLGVLQDQAISAKDAALRQLREDEAASRDMDRQSAQSHRQRMADIAESKAGEQRRHNQVIEKAGGKITAPTTAERDSATAAIATEIFGGKIPESISIEIIDAGADAIASRAKEIAQQSGGGVNWNEALIRATVESQQAGDWEIDSGERDWALDEEPSATFGKGRTPATAMALPADRAQWKRGKYYIGGNGAVAKWNGTSFVTEE